MLDENTIRRMQSLAGIQPTSILENIDLDSDEMLEEWSLKNWLTGIAIAASTLAPNVGKSQTAPEKPAVSQQVTAPRKVLQTIKVVGPEGRQKLSNPDLDMVHGILGSKRLDDDFEQIVGDKLAQLNEQGYATDVKNVKIETKIEGEYIVTRSSCDIVQSTDGYSYSAFTTRGSIGDGFAARHDTQVNGLVGRLKGHYGGPAKSVGTFTQSFMLKGKKVSYKQSFFVASRNSEPVFDVTAVKSDKPAPVSADSTGPVYERPNGLPSQDPNDYDYTVRNVKGTTTGTTYTELGRAVEKEIGDALKQIEGGIVLKYVPKSIKNNAGKVIGYQIDWEISNKNPLLRYTSFTRRGYIANSKEAAKAGARQQINAVGEDWSLEKRIAMAGFNAYSPVLKDGVTVDLGNGTFMHEMPILIDVREAPPLKNSIKIEERFSRMRMLAGITPLNG